MNGNEKYKGIIGIFKRLESKSYKMHIRVLLSRYRTAKECLKCNGSKIGTLASNVKIHDFFLIDYQTNIDEKMINQLSFEKKLSFFKELHCTPSMNPELEDRIKSADLIIYSPGTQHSSLLPTYLTNNLGKLISD